MPDIQYFKAKRKAFNLRISFSELMRRLLQGWLDGVIELPEKVEK